MLLKDEIIKNINRMDINELLYLKTVIRNINKNKSSDSSKKNSDIEMEVIRKILKNKNLSAEIDSLRKDRI
jgi:hypothetical protein